ncbi:MAG: PAS domain S-box protein [Chloroflexi bacterium]|nr:PAS domain S-box protein [Chloroflexota bacterium]
MAIGVPREAVFAGIERAFARNAAALGVVGLLALLAAWFGGDLFVLRRVRALVRATKRLAGGDLRVRTGPPYGAGEIGDLSRAFDAMADALQRLLGEHQRAEAALLAAQEELEQRVRERTADLARANEALRTEVWERKRAEERYRSLVESTPDGIAVHRGGTLVYLNAAAAHIIGASSAEQMVGRPVLDFVHPDYVDAVRQRVRRVLEEGTPAPLVEERLIRLDGTPIDVEIVAIPTTYEGQPAVQVVIRDITARKRSEEELRRSYERLAAQGEIDRAILAARSPQDVARAALSRIRRLVPCQRAAVMLLDAGRREARVIAADEDRPLGLPEGVSVPFDELWSPIVSPQGRPWYFADLAALEQRSPTMEHSLATGVRSLMLAPMAVEQELVGVLTLAATRPAAFRPEHVEIASELATSLAVVLHGARLQASLAAEEQLLRTLVDNLPEGVILLDGAHRIVLANAAARAYLPLLTSAVLGDTLAAEDGWSVEELCALPPHGGWREVVVPGPQPRVFELAARCVAGAADGQSCVLVVREVTQERTVQAQLERQERLATVGQLAAGIGHDFNNLLAGIMLYAEVLEVRYDLPDDAREKLGIIIRQCHRGAGLARQILDFSRQSASQKQPLDLVPFSKELWKLFQRTLPEDVRVTFTSERPEHWVQADPTQLQQVVTNLAINARDAMPGGGVLALRLSHLALGEEMPPPCAGMSPGGWVRLEVSDTGTGIAPEILPRIFEPFFTTKEPGRGTGLGLAQVYGLVRQHGGHVDVASQVDVGTSFSIYLPALQRQSASGRDELEAGVGGGETILLVEDDPVVRDALSALLEELGCQVLAAANGDDALRLHERHRHEIALVVTDLVMPAMNGLALLRALRERAPQLTAVVMTGYAPDEGEEELRAKGIVGWIEKPMDRAQLMHVIRRALG